MSYILADYECPACEHEGPHAFYPAEELSEPDLAKCPECDCEFEVQV